MGKTASSLLPANKLIMNEEPIYTSHRSSVISRIGIVAASQPLAVAAGLELLRQGGNAADAAIAVAAALNVTEPTSTGIGGDCFAIYYDAQTQRLSGLNGSGRAPARLTLELLQRSGFGQELPPYHPYTITVPGACAGWCDLLERHGRLGIGKALAPAIRLAKEGFPVAPLTSYFWQRGANNQLSRAPGGQELTIEGRGPNPGEIFRNPGLARTLQHVAENGKAGFYTGKIAEAIADTVQRAGGCLVVEDLEQHTSAWVEPIGINYRGFQLWELPPNGQGLAALIGLNILEGFDLASCPPLSVERLHLQIEAMRLAFADVHWYVADPDFNPAPLEVLLSKAYAAQRRKQIDLRRAALEPQRGIPLASSDTVYFSVVDSQGNACSFINSNYMGFGTGIIPCGWGFSLQNRGHNFSLQPGHPNQVAPGKRPYHTIIPAMATRPDGSLFASFGVMGGFMQPQGHLQVFSALVDDHLSPQAALDRARFCIQQEDIALEDGIPLQTLQGLAALGHPVQSVGGQGRALFGRGQVILRETDGVYWAGSDPRADGCAMTLLPTA
jgi:gamma-glutamyltranspeptidase/glutathione hydrolase